MAEGLYRQPVTADSVRTGVPSLLLSHFGDHPFLGGRTNTSPKRGPIATAPRIALAALVVRRRICSVVVSLIFFGFLYSSGAIIQSLYYSNLIVEGG
jgi:hypothetical protein